MNQQVIVKKVILREAPGPGPKKSGIYLTVEPTEASLVYGLYAGTLAEGHDNVTVDWGDGTVETLPGFSMLTHTYAAAGEYVVKVSDDLANLACSAAVGQHVFTKVYAKLLKAVVVSAKNLTTLNTAAFRQSDNLITADFSESAIDALPVNCFWGCAALSGSITFPKVGSVAGTSATNVAFYGCTALEAIHFAKSAEASIKASSGYLADPHLGAANATVMFDL